jgi:hypothetical protein
MPKSVFSPTAIKSYAWLVIGLSLICGLSVLLGEPGIACACADQEPGTSEYAAQQAALEVARGERPMAALSSMVFCLAVGAIFFFLMEIAARLLSSVFGPYR